MINSAAFLTALKEEIARLQQIQALLETDSADARLSTSVQAPLVKRKNRMSEAGRARVAEAQRKRWAAKKAMAAMPALVATNKQKVLPAKKSAKTAPAEPAVGKRSASAAKTLATALRKAPAKKPVMKGLPPAKSAAKKTTGQAAPNTHARKAAEPSLVKAGAEVKRANRIVPTAPSSADTALKE